MQRNTQDAGDSAEVNDRQAAFCTGTMDLEQAKRILNISAEDDIGAVKRKYRRLIGCRREENKGVAGGVNEKAFCDRKIYLYYTLEVSEKKPYYQF